MAVMSFAPAADMQRTIQRSNALPTMIRPYSNSDNSALVSETRCSDETILVGWRDMVFTQDNGEKSVAYGDIFHRFAQILIDKLSINYQQCTFLTWHRAGCPRSTNGKPQHDTT